MNVANISAYIPLFLELELHQNRDFHGVSGARKNRDCRSLAIYLQSATEKKESYANRRSISGALLNLALTEYCVHLNLEVLSLRGK